MKENNNKLIAEPGAYLLASNGKRGFALEREEGVTYEEQQLADTVEARPYGAWCIGGVFQVQKTATTKRDMIAQIWTNDDQIAIMLNREESQEASDMYDFMQRWRAWISAQIKKMR